MPEFSGRLRAVGRVAILVSRYNELVTAGCSRARSPAAPRPGSRATTVDVVWVPGAFELPVAAAAAAGTGRYACLVALGAVIRGETPHFEYVAGETARGLGEVAVPHALPVGFGVLTVDTLQQAADAGRRERGKQGVRGGGGGARRPRTSSRSSGRGDAQD